MVTSHLWEGGNISEVAVDTVVCIIVRILTVLETHGDAGACIQMALEPPRTFSMLTNSKHGKTSISQELRIKKSCCQPLMLGTMVVVGSPFCSSVQPANSTLTPLILASPPDFWQAPTIVSALPAIRRSYPY